MIFAKTIDLVLSGKKTQTCRLAYAGDYLFAPAIPSNAEPDGLIPYSVRRADGKVRWIVGHTYGIQPERCHTSRGRFRCTYLREVPDPTTVDADFVRAEGLDTIDEYLRIWHELHTKNPIQRCWAIGIELLKGKR